MTFFFCCCLALFNYGLVNWINSTTIDVNATLHPVTGEKILAPFRMSAFVPANVLIAAGLLIPGAGVCLLFDFIWI